MDLTKHNIWTSRPHLPLEETEGTTQDKELDFQYGSGTPSAETVSEAFSEIMFSVLSGFLSLLQ